jgi:hypothetical protein
MQTYHIMRVVLSGTTQRDCTEQFSTLVRVSSCELAAGEHLGQARFRAVVRGLRAPWRVDAEYEVARTHHDFDAVLHHDARHQETSRCMVGDAHGGGEVGFSVTMPVRANPLHSKAA